MSTPVVAIVGAPNVGKSTLFNRLIGQRRSIVSDQSGVTRDRLTAECDLYGKNVLLVDTGGVVPGDSDDLTRRVGNEALKAVAEADLILFMADARAGLTATDLEIGSVLRISGKPIVPVANKIDSLQAEGLTSEMYRLGLGEVVSLSAEQGRGIDTLIERIRTGLPRGTTTAKAAGVPIAIIGRPNVGKSSLFNRIVRQDRSVVYPMPGTTRDPVDAVFERSGTLYRIVDTAGIRRHVRSGEEVEWVSVLKARQALERCEIAIALIDGSESIAHQDQAILGLVQKSRKPALLAVNKIDLLPEAGVDWEEREQEIRHAIRFSTYVPIVPISAMTGTGIGRLLKAMEQLRLEANRRFSTSDLNTALAALVREMHPPSDRGREVRFFYMTQIGGSPPRFIIFSNGRKVGASYRRYMEGRLRSRLGLVSSPLVLRIRQRPGSR